MTDVTFDTPFPAEEIKQRDGRGGMKYSYVDARCVHQRLDDVVGTAGWQTTYRLIDPGSYAIECTLQVRIDGEWITKTDVGYPNSERDEEPLKSAYSDATKRAAVQFGIGRHLYSEKPTQTKREAPPASPTTQAAFDQAKLMALMAEKQVTMLDLLPVTGKSPTGRPTITQWFTSHPGKTIDDLVSLAVDTKQQALADAHAGT